MGIVFITIVVLICLVVGFAWHIVMKKKNQKIERENNEQIQEKQRDKKLKKRLYMMNYFKITQKSTVAVNEFPQFTEE